jgi:hypothetical protein
MVKIFEWMKALPDNRKLVELCLPGSHDAGVYTDEDNDVTPGETARCQYEKIGEQASCGSRVFDIRVFLKGTGFLGRTKIPTMGHFFADKAPLGDWGGTLKSALQDAITFLTSFPSEFLIFRIGHTDCLEEVGAVLEEIRNTTNGKTGKTNATLFHRGAKSLADVEVGHLRGKLVVLCDNELLQTGNFKPGDGYYLYDKYLPTFPSTAQIRFCGKYTGDLKTKAKTSTEDQGNWSPQGAVKNAEEGCQEHKTHPSNHLLWVYWQETGGNVWANTRATGGMKDRLDNFLSRFKDTKNNLPLPNVIGHDFVDKFTCGKIAKMNKPVDTQLESYVY